MVDIVDKKTRSKMMSKIRGKDTKPEMIIRRGLHERGFRFRLHQNDLPGSPDLVLTKYATAIFVNGCFWHCHDCDFFRLPKTNRAFWKQKLESNKKRDLAAVKKLLDDDWYVAMIWECAIRRREDKYVSGMFESLTSWLTRVEYRRHLRIFR